MYPTGDLKELQHRKAMLQARIAVRRWECTVAATELSRPIASLDRILAAWQRISPMAKLLAVPAGMMLARLFGRGTGGGRKKRGKLGTLLALAPLIFRGAKMAMSMRAAFAADRQARSARVARGTAEATG